MEKICLDFEASLDFLRGEASILEKIKWYADREDVCISAFTMAHLYECVKKPEVMNALLNSVTVLPFDRKAADVFRRLVSESRDKGNEVKNADHFVTASICMANDAFLFTKSPKNYEGIKGLRKV